MQTAVMTTGSSLRHILIFAIPLFIGNIFQQVYTMVGTMIAGLLSRGHFISLAHIISGEEALFREPCYLCDISHALIDHAIAVEHDAVFIKCLVAA